MGDTAGRCSRVAARPEGAPAHPPRRFWTTWAGLAGMGLACAPWTNPTSPFSGDQGLELVLRCDRPWTDVDVDALKRRAMGLGIRASAASATEGAVVQLPGVDLERLSPELPALLAAGKLGFHRPVEAADARVEAPWGGADGYTADVRANDPPTPSPDPTRFIVGRACAQGGACTDHLLHPADNPAGVVADASALVGPNHPQPAVDVQLTEAGRQWFFELTTRQVGHKVVITLDGAVLMAPIVHQPIRDGRVTITLGHGAVQDDAAALATRLRGPPLPDCTISHEARIGPPTGG